MTSEYGGILFVTMPQVKRLRPLNRRPAVMTIRVSPAERAEILDARAANENLSDTLRRLLTVGLNGVKDPAKEVEKQSR